MAQKTLLTEEQLLQKMISFAYEYLGIEEAESLLELPPLDATELIVNKKYAAEFLRYILSKPLPAQVSIDDIIAGFEGYKTSNLKDAIRYALLGSTDNVVDDIVEHAMSYRNNPVALDQILKRLIERGMETDDYKDILNVANAFDLPQLHNILDSNQLDDEDSSYLVVLVSNISYLVSSKKMAEEALEYARQFAGETLSFVCDGLAGVAYAVFDDDINLFYRALNAAKLYERNVLDALMDALIRATEDPDLENMTKSSVVIEILKAAEEHSYDPDFAREIFLDFAEEIQYQKTMISRPEDI